MNEFIFTVDQLSERGYPVWYSAEIGQWCWSTYRVDLVIPPCSSKEQAIRAASAHCRNHYVPKRSEGVPEHAEFRLPKKGDTFLRTQFGDKLKAENIIVSWPGDEYNNRRWCWREENKPKYYTATTFPQGMVWVRGSGWAAGCRAFVVGIAIGSVKIEMPLDTRTIPFEELAEGYQISLDGGNTWRPARPER